MRRVRRFKVSRETVKEADPKRQDRNKRYRAGLEERGIRAFQVVAPETAKGLFRRAAELMTRDNDPMEPRQAMRLIGGANEPESGDVSPALAAELEAARNRIIEIECEAEARRVTMLEAVERHREALEAERNEAAKSAREAHSRAEAAESVIRQAKNLPGFRGRLVRWLVGGVLPN